MKQSPRKRVLAVALYVIALAGLIGLIFWPVKTDMTVLPETVVRNDLRFLYEHWFEELQRNANRASDLDVERLLRDRGSEQIIGNVRYRYNDSIVGETFSDLSDSTWVVEAGWGKKQVLVDVAGRVHRVD